EPVHRRVGEGGQGHGGRHVLAEHEPERLARGDLHGLGAGQGPHDVLAVGVHRQQLVLGPDALASLADEGGALVVAHRARSSTKVRSHSRNAGPTSSRRVAKSTVACRNPSLSPASCRTSSSTTPRIGSSWAMVCSASVTWISPPAPGRVSASTGKIDPGST